VLAATKTSRTTERSVYFAKKASLQPPPNGPQKPSAFCESGVLSKKQKALGVLWKPGFFTKRLTGVLAQAVLRLILDTSDGVFESFVTSQ
jgi:hypothetical protein